MLVFCLVTFYSSLVTFYFSLVTRHLLLRGREKFYTLQRKNLGTKEKSISTFKLGLEASKGNCFLNLRGYRLIGDWHRSCFSIGIGRVTYCN